MMFLFIISAIGLGSLVIYQIFFDPYKDLL